MYDFGCSIMFNLLKLHSERRGPDQPLASKYDEVYVSVFNFVLLKRRWKFYEVAFQNFQCTYRTCCIIVKKDVIAETEIMSLLDLIVVWRHDLWSNVG